jgi:Na+/glutamate symporter
VPSADIGTASAAFTTMRQLGGAFGVAVLGAALAMTGGYATPAAFSHGFTTAFAVAAGLALTAAAVGTILTRPREPPVTRRAGQARTGVQRRPDSCREGTRSAGRQPPVSGPLAGLTAPPCTESTSHRSWQYAPRRVHGHD